MTIHFSTLRFGFTRFQALGLPCLRERIPTTVNGHGQQGLLRTYYRVRVEELPGLRGDRLIHLRRSTKTLGELLDRIETL